jgi:hypothetical protein
MVAPIVARATDIMAGLTMVAITTVTTAIAMVIVTGTTVTITKRFVWLVFWFKAGTRVPALLLPGFRLVRVPATLEGGDSV